MDTDNLVLGNCTVQDAVQEIACFYQVSFVTLHLFRGGDDAQNQPYVRTNYPDAWVSHYLLNDNVRIDPILQMAQTTPGLFCWSLITPQPHQLDMMDHDQIIDDMVGKQ